LLAKGGKAAAQSGEPGHEVLHLDVLPQRVCQHVREPVVDRFRFRRLKGEPHQLDAMLAPQALGQLLLLKELSQVVIPIYGVHADAQPP